MLVVQQVVQSFIIKFLPFDFRMLIGIKTSSNESVHNVIPIVFRFGMLKNIMVIRLADFKEFVFSGHNFSFNWRQFVTDSPCFVSISFALPTALATVEHLLYEYCCKWQRLLVYLCL